MPFAPHQLFGSLASHDLDEYGDTSYVQEGFDFNPRVTIREKSGHVGGETPHYNAIRQVQVFNVAADMETKGEIIPNAAGKAVGLANVSPGTAITLANFAAPADGAVDPETVHGWLRDATKLLMAKEVKRSLTLEKGPAVTVPATYYPLVAAAA